MRVEIVAEWHYWNGFVNGIVRIDDLLFFADMNDFDGDAERRYHAQSLFHLLYPLVRFPANLDSAQANPGLVRFRESDLVRLGENPEGDPK